jgi:hypothetical protein
MERGKAGVRKDGLQWKVRSSGRIVGEESRQSRCSSRDAEGCRQCILDHRPKCPHAHVKSKVSVDAGGGA